MAVAVQLAPQFTYGNPIKLFDTSMYLLSGPTAAGRTYDISADGRRFLLVKNAEGGNTAPPTSASVTVVLNWLEELKSKTPIH